MINCLIYIENNLLMNRSPYPSDLSNDEWELLQPLIPVNRKKP